MNTFLKSLFLFLILFFIGCDVKYDRINSVTSHKVETEFGWKYRYFITWDCDSIPDSLVIRIQK